MRTLTIKKAEIARAIVRAHATTDDWQAECIEILMLPSLYRRWQQKNGTHFRMPTLTRHPGLPYRETTREDNLARGQAETWHEMAGYLLRFGPTFGWNSVRPDCYSHGASCCWDGLRRETDSGFAQDIRSWYYTGNDRIAFDLLTDYGINVVLVHD